MNYLGSKLSLIDFLSESIEQVVDLNSEGVFADLFAGTGIVGSTFRNKGYTVISNDLQYYSYVLNKHFIENSEKVSFDIVDYLNNLKGVEGFVYQTYCNGSCGRNYFTDENGKRCDAMRMEIDRLYLDGEISENQYFYLLASLLNSIDKCANTASTYVSYLKHIKATALNHVELKLLPMIEGKSGRVYNEDSNSLISKLNGDILYIDPPYNERQYCAYYHVLETVARYDDPAVHGLTGMRDYTVQKSQYCSKRTVFDSFEELISRANFKYIFLSYNNEGLMPFEYIQSVMSKYGKYVVFTKEYSRYRSDKPDARNHKADTTMEYLHCLIK